jgi:aspartyl-tRNA(Asn)/glutamyl-tRNA(Gln) amidotransferase subunit B
LEFGERVLFRPKARANANVLLVGESGTGKELFAELLGGSFDVRAAIAERGLGQISDDGALKQLASEVLAANPQALADWKAGKQQAIGFLVGQAMKASKGRGDAAQLGAVFKTLLDA